MKCPHRLIIDWAYLYSRNGLVDTYLQYISDKSASISGRIGVTASYSSSSALTSPSTTPGIKRLVLQIARYFHFGFNFHKVSTDLS